MPTVFYTRLATDALVGLMLLVFVQEKHASHVAHKVPFLTMARHAHLRISSGVSGENAGRFFFSLKNATSASFCQECFPPSNSTCTCMGFFILGFHVELSG